MSTRRSAAASAVGRAATHPAASAVAASAPTSTATSTTTTTTAGKGEASDDVAECSVCKDTLTDQETILLACGHFFHTLCMQEWCKNQYPCTCPLCRADLDIASAKHYDEAGRDCAKHKDWDKVIEDSRAAALDQEGFVGEIIDHLLLSLLAYSSAAAFDFENMVSVPTLLPLLSMQNGTGLVLRIERRTPVIPSPMEVFGALNEVTHHPPRYAATYGPAFPPSSPSSASSASSTSSASSASSLSSLSSVSSSSSSSSSSSASSSHSASSTSSGRAAGRGKKRRGSDEQDGAGAAPAAPTAAPTTTPTAAPAAPVSVPAPRAQEGDANPRPLKRGRRTTRSRADEP